MVKSLLDLLCSFQTKFINPCDSFDQSHVDVIWSHILILNHKRNSLTVSSLSFCFCWSFRPPMCVWGDGETVQFARGSDCRWQYNRPGPSSLWSSARHSLRTLVILTIYQWLTICCRSRNRSMPLRGWLFNLPIHQNHPWSRSNSKNT